MTVWRTVSVGEALEFAYGKALPKSIRVDDGHVPVYGSNGVTGWHSEALVDGPTVIVGCKGSAGAVQYVEGPCFPIDTTYYVKPRSGFQFDPRFVFYLLRHADLPRLRTATGVPGLTREDVYSKPISFPPLDEQRRIVDLLSRAEGILRLRREAQTKAQAIIPALFLDMFGDPATNPKGWPVQPLGSLADVQGGLQVTRARETLPIEHPYLRVANVHRDNLDLTEVKTIRMTEAEWLRTALRPGDLLVVEGHGNPQEVGRVAVWDGQFPDCTHQNHLIRARPDSASLLPSYACALLNSASGRQALVRSGKTTSGLSTISAKNVKETPVMLPPLEVQERFHERCSAAQSVIVQQAAAVKKVETAFQSLLAYAFSGRTGGR